MKDLLHKIQTNPLLLTAALLIIAVVLLLTVTEVTKQPKLEDGAEVVVRVDRAQLEATVAASADSRIKGLSGTESLGENQGMLFVSGQEEIPMIVMRDMNYPIDVIWISQGTVSEVTPNVQPQTGVPEDQLTKYQPAGPANQVLETQAGWAAKHGIQPGDPVKISSL